MSIKFTNTAKALKIEWTAPDMSQTATFQVPKQATEEEQVKALLKAVGFLGMQTGVVPPVSPASVNSTTTTVSTPTAGATATAAAPPPSAPLILGTPPASLSDRPADGGPPNNQEFWQSMPTLAVPQHLAGEAQGGWEMIPPGEV